MIIQPGDIVQTKEPGNFISEGIAGKTVSNFSHSMPVIDSRGTLVSADFPKVRYRSLKDYFNGEYRVEIIRPVKPYTSRELDIWIAAARDKVGKWYDVLSILGNLVNKKWQHRDMWQCAEICLHSFHQIGRFTCIPLRKAEPKTFEILTCTMHGSDTHIWRCDLPFTSVAKWYKPGPEEYEKLKNSKM